MWLNIYIWSKRAFWNFLEIYVLQVGFIIQNILGHFMVVTFFPRQNITETNIGLIKGLRWEEGTLGFNMTLNHFGTIWPILEIKFAKKVMIYVPVVLLLSLSEIGFIHYINTKMFIINFRIEFQGPLKSCTYFLLDWGSWFSWHRLAVVCTYNKIKLL